MSNEVLNVVWFTNVLSPDLCHKTGVLSNPYGGWLHESSRLLSNKENIKLTIISPYHKDIDIVEVGNISYLTFSHLDKLEEIILKLSPDVVHVYGTELPHSLKVAKVCSKYSLKSVFSIQGLTTICGRKDCLTSGLPFRVVFGQTLRNIIRKDSVIGLMSKFKQLAKSEIETLNLVTNVIGRTQWDRESVFSINPNLNYFHCNEILRESFYASEKWSLDSANKFQIYVSQGHYPIKGLHYMLQALRLVVDTFPETKLVVGGKNVTNESVKGIAARTKYADYLLELIEEFNLKEHVEFAGELAEDGVRKMLLSSHVSVCPSTIENSPNSVGEAMILGVPVIASYVGGVPDLLIPEKEGLCYPSNSPELLACAIKRVFSDSALANELSLSSILRANKTHSRETNTETLLSIYRDII
ncbi:glycosyltransferase family 4 protein [Enterovibrio norvegicus]|uniref:glycosyltransferase family 4 protein n=1 Tax=Enterovibrio norvegicus TaxID=188144 RepID=UPI0013D5AE5B|nr:glycosyltransferase [Enterovibrio norvegicus]